MFKKFFNSFSSFERFSIKLLFYFILTLMVMVGFPNGYKVGPKIEAIIPTKNGHHLITKRFDVKKFKEKYPNIDIQKKNPSLLFLPNSLDI